MDDEIQYRLDVMTSKIEASTAQLKRIADTLERLLKISEMSL